MSIRQQTGSPQDTVISDSGGLVMAIAEEKGGKKGWGQRDPNFVMYMCHSFQLFPFQQGLKY